MTPKNNAHKRPTSSGNKKHLGVAALFLFSTFFFLQMGIAFFPVPEQIMGWLSCDEVTSNVPPRYVVLLGGNIPSQSGLIRAYYTANAGRGHDDVTYIISMPADGDPAKGAPALVRDELVLRGISPKNIVFESRGTNTYEEAFFTYKLLGDEALREPLIIVTSPSHMRRAFLCFLKQGFQEVTCLPAKDIHYPVDIGSGGFFRYTLWYRLASEPLIARELVALCVYKIKGWI